MIKIEDITQYTGSEYGVYRFQAKATDEKDKVYADSELSNTVIYNIPLLNLSISNREVTITGFITGISEVDIYLDEQLNQTIPYNQEESLSYIINQTVPSDEVHKIYAVAKGDQIRENYSNTVIYGVLPTFADNSWDTIASVSNQISKLSLTGDLLYDYIKQTYGWEANGMYKPFTTTTGDTYGLQIWDFNDKTDENGDKNGITFGCIELQKTTASMNATSTNTGGFGASKLATVTLPSIYEVLPEDLKKHIIKSHITYHSGSDDPTTELNGNFYLYIPSEFEVSGKTSYALQEGQWLKYWKEHNTNQDRIKYRLGTTSSTSWWLRSAYRYYSNYFAIVNSDGNLNFNNAYYSYGVCFCLSIK